MASEPSENDVAHKVISDGILNSLQESIAAGHYGNQGMVAGFITIVEIIDEEGESSMSVLYGDKRLTVLLGLLAYGHLWVGSHNVVRGSD